MADETFSHACGLTGVIWSVANRYMSGIVCALGTPSRQAPFLIAILAWSVYHTVSAFKKQRSPVS